MLRLVHTWQPRNRAQLFFTYVVPVSIIASTWDAIASNLRMYQPEDFAGMTEDLASDTYTWETGTLQAAEGRQPVTYVIGYPASVPAELPAALPAVSALAGSSSR